MYIKIFKFNFAIAFCFVMDNFYSIDLYIMKEHVAIRVAHFVILSSFNSKCD